MGMLAFLSSPFHYLAFRRIPEKACHKDRTNKSKTVFIFQREMGSGLPHSFWETSLPPWSSSSWVPQLSGSGESSPHESKGADVHTSCKVWKMTHFPQGTQSHSSPTGLSVKYFLSSASERCLVSLLRWSAGNSGSTFNTPNQVHSSKEIC